MNFYFIYYAHSVCHVLHTQLKDGTLQCKRQINHYKDMINAIRKVYERDCPAFLVNIGKAPQGRQSFKM